MVSTCDWAPLQGNIWSLSLSLQGELDPCGERSLDLLRPPWLQGPAVHPGARRVPRIPEVELPQRPHGILQTHPHGEHLWRSRDCLKSTDEVIWQIWDFTAVRKHNFIFFLIHTFKNVRVCFSCVSERLTLWVFSTEGKPSFLALGWSTFILKLQLLRPVCDVGFVVGFWPNRVRLSGSTASTTASSCSRAVTSPVSAWTSATTAPSCRAAASPRTASTLWRSTETEREFLLYQKP